MSQSRFKLGDRVVMSATVRKAKLGHRVTYVLGKLPHRMYGNTTVTFSHGVIVGKRTVQEGEWGWEEEGSYFLPTEGTAKSVWLVSFDMHMKPVMCFDNQVELV